MERAMRFRRRLRNGASVVSRVEALEPRTLFSLAIASAVTFSGNLSGIQPVGLVMDGDGDFFGVTARGGSKGYGTVFEIAAGTSTETTLASFTGANGIYPDGNLVLDSGGTLWGTTTGGGSSNKGTIFSFFTGSTTSTITTVVSFNGVNGDSPTDGLFTDAAGNMYGTTVGSTHGTASASTLFSMAAGGGALTVLASFNPNDTVLGGLVIDSSGDIFGTTSRGGTKKLGTVFEFPAGSTASTVTTLASFTGGNGEVPTGNLLLDSGGNIIGTTGGGGSKSDGTVFRLNATANTITTLASFGGSNGSRPVGDLLTDASGNYFGVTAQGGAHGNGTVFELVAGTTSTITALYSFSGKSAGQNPTGPLIADADGNFFGATYLGGIVNRGVIFELSPSGLAQPAPDLTPQKVSATPPANIKSGVAFTLVVKLQDSGGGLLSGASSLVSVAIASGPGGGVLAGTLAVDAVSGMATLSGLTLSAPGKYTLQITVGDLVTVTKVFTVK